MKVSVTRLQRTASALDEAAAIVDRGPEQIDRAAVTTLLEAAALSIRRSLIFDRPDT